MAGAWTPPRTVERHDAEAIPPDGVTRLLRRARFQPLLLAGSALTVLPLVLTSGAPGWVVAYVFVVVIAGVGAWLWARSVPLGRTRRQTLSLSMTLLAVGGLVVVLAGTGWSPVLDLLLLIATFGALVAIAPDRRMAWLVQLTIAVVLVLALMAVAGPLLVALVTVQIVAIMVVADTFAQRLLGVRATEQAARRDAERRGQLLTAVRHLPRGSVHDAEQAAVDTLRALVFDTAAVVRVEDDRLWERVVEGARPIGAPVERGRGLAWQAIIEDRTLVTDRYHTDASGLPGREWLRGAVATPIRVDGRPVGALAGGRTAARRPNDDEVEIVEVMAAHLGAVMTNRATVRRQQELLEQAARLDRMGRGLLEAVSEEIEEPLRTLRSTAQALMDQGAELEPGRSAELLRQLGRESEQLRLVLDTILDFSRFHARRADPRLEPLPLGRLLDGAGIAVASQHPAAAIEDGDRVATEDLTVLADRELAVAALSLVVAACQPDRRQPTTVELDTAAQRGQVGLVFQRGRLAGGSNVLISVAVQLLVAGGGRLDGGEATGQLAVWFRLTATGTAGGHGP
ncbi:MAG: GAF domain-containing protein [Nitriliruptoraceae bacterium]